MKDVITGFVFISWFAGFCMCVHGFADSDIAEAIARGMVFIGTCNMVRGNG